MRRPSCSWWRTAPGVTKNAAAPNTHEALTSLCTRAATSVSIAASGPASQRLKIWTSLSNGANHARRNFPCWKLCLQVSRRSLNRSAFQNPQILSLASSYRAEQHNNCIIQSCNSFQPLLDHHDVQDITGKQTYLMVNIWLIHRPTCRAAQLAVENQVYNVLLVAKRGWSPMKWPHILS